MSEPIEEDLYSEESFSLSDGIRTYIFSLMIVTMVRILLASGLTLFAYLNLRLLLSSRSSIFIFFFFLLSVIYPLFEIADYYRKRRQVSIALASEKERNMMVS